MEITINNEFYISFTIYTSFYPSTFSPVTGWRGMILRPASDEQQVTDNATSVVEAWFTSWNLILCSVYIVQSPFSIISRCYDRVLMQLRADEPPWAPDNQHNDGDDDIGNILQYLVCYRWWCHTGAQGV
jgi:hypothetical protein